MTRPSQIASSRISSGVLSPIIFAPGLFLLASSVHAGLVAEWTAPQGIDFGYTSSIDTVSEPILADTGTGNIIFTRQLTGTNPPEFGAQYSFKPSANSTVPPVDDGTGVFSMSVDRNRVATADVTFNTLGQSGVIVEWDVRQTGSLAPTVTIQHSTDGINYTIIGGGANGSGWQQRVNDLSSFTFLDNQPSVMLRLRLTGGSSSSSAMGDLDNIRIRTVTVPEPSTTLTFAAIGVLGCVTRRRR